VWTDGGKTHRRGRKQSASFLIDIATDIDQIHGVDGFLAVASSGYPSIRIYGKTPRGQLAIQCLFRLIGHTGGITAMVSRNGPDGLELISGSNDGLVKIWSLKTRALQLTLQRASRESDDRGWEVTTLHAAVWQDRDRPLSLVFAGHKKGIVRAWDITTRAPMFDLVLQTAPSVRKSAVLAQQEQYFWFGPFMGNSKRPEAEPPPEPGEPLVPRAIDFNLALLPGRCSLSVLGLKTTGTGNDGEIQTFEFSAIP
jgi:WD40 repeat protein